jgi:hypothetical protein
MKLRVLYNIYLVEINDKFYFLFNLSLLTNTERILKSELFINKRYIRHKLAFDIHYLYYSIKSSDASSIKLEKSDKLINKSETMHYNIKKAGNGPSMSIDLANFKYDKYRKANGWQSFSMISSINSYLAMRRAAEKSSIESKKLNNTGRFVYYTSENKTNLDNLNEYLNRDDELVLMMECKNLKKNIHNKFTLASVQDVFNPYMIIYSFEDEAKMKYFFQNRIPQVLIDNPNEPSFTKPNKNLVEQESKISLTHNREENEYKELKSYENQVDKMNELFIGETAAVDSFENSITATSTSKNDLNDQINSMNALNVKKSSPIKSKSAQTSNKNSILYYNYLPKSEYGFNRTILIEGLDSLDELRFFLQGMKSSISKKSKRDIISKRSAMPRISPSLDDLNEENEDGSSFDDTKWNLNDYYNHLSDNKKENEIKLSERKKCRAEAINVDFDDISFSSWILEPKNFMTSYCSGLCKFPANNVKLEIFVVFVAKIFLIFNLIFFSINRK